MSDDSLVYQEVETAGELICKIFVAHQLPHIQCLIRYCDISYDAHQQLLILDALAVYKGRERDDDCLAELLVQQGFSFFFPAAYRHLNILVRSTNRRFVIRLEDSRFGEIEV